MKPALIATIVLAFAVHFAPWCEAKEKAAEITYCSNQQQPRALAVVFAFAVHTNQQGSASRNDKGQNNSPNGDDTAQWILIGITGITAGFICWQAWETRKASQAANKSAGVMESQTTILQQALSHAEKSANAAETSAQAAMGTAIPRLMLFSFDFAPMGAANFAAKIQYPKIRIVVKNYGQTPAFLKSYGVEFTCEPLPEEPVYRHTKPIPPEHAVEAGHTLGIPFGDIYVTPKEFLSDSDIRDVMDANKSLVVYGFVRYEDFFGSTDRELRFCKRLDFDPTNPNPPWWAWEEYGNQKYSNQQNPN